MCEYSIGNLSLVITVCHHKASLVMPNGDPQDIFFYPTLTLMMDSYSLEAVSKFMDIPVISLEGFV